MFDVWKRTAQSVISMRHSGISDILEGRPCPVPKLIRPRPSSVRSKPSRPVTRNEAAEETDVQSGIPPAETAQKNVQPDAGSTLSRGHGVSTTIIDRIFYTPTRNIRFMGHGREHLEFGRHQHLAPRQPSSFRLPVPEHIGSCGHLSSKIQAEPR